MSNSKDNSISSINSALVNTSSPKSNNYDTTTSSPNSAWSSYSSASDQSSSNHDSCESKSITKFMQALIEDIEITDELRDLICFMLKKIESLEMEIRTQKTEKNIVEKIESLETELNEIHRKTDAYSTNLEIFAQNQTTSSNNFEEMESKVKSTTDHLQKKIKEINLDLDEYADLMYNMECRIINNEQYSRRENLVISGIPENVKQNDLENTVLNIIHSIGWKEVSSYEISSCHRLAKNPSSKYPAHTIVRFTNRKIPEYCLKNRYLLSQSNLRRQLGMNLRFYENLCPSNEKVVKLCTKLKAEKLIFDYKTAHGFVSIKAKDGDTFKKIKHTEDLYDLFYEYFDDNREY